MTLRTPPRGVRLAVAAAGAVVALLAAACGSDDGDGAAGGDAEILPFEQVQASDMTFEADPTDPGRGIFRVTTSEPMICAIVWGTDDSYGRFNNSLAMDGTGIEQHDVLLPDVQPGVEYRFVVQGTTADGQLYRSEPGTFTIEGAGGAGDAGDASGGAGDASGGAGGDDDTGGPGGENVAVGADVVDVSSEFSDAFAASFAVDGDTDTEWATSGDGDDGSITLDLGSERQVSAIEFVTRSMADGSSITDTYTVTVLDGDGGDGDGESGDGGDPLGPFPAGTVADPRPSEVDLTGQVLRFDVETSTGGNVGAVEIRIYAPG